MTKAESKVIDFIKKHILLFTRCGNDYCNFPQSLRNGFSKR